VWVMIVVYTFLLGCDEGLGYVMYVGSVEAF